MTTKQLLNQLPTNGSNVSGYGNWSEDDLIRLNDDKAVTLIPAMLCIGLYIVIGIVGNTLVCYVMGFKLKSTTQNLLIVYLAVFDLLSCLISMPTDIYDMRNYYMFPSEIACKILRMIMAFTSIGSILTLVVIAVDRYRMICRATKRQFYIGQIKLSLIGILIGAFIFSFPAVFIFGFRTIETGIPGYPGWDCSTSDSAKDTIFPLLYLIVLFLVFVILAVVLIVLYCFVLITRNRHCKYMLSKSVRSRLNLQDSDVTDGEINSGRSTSSFIKELSITQNQTDSDYKNRSSTNHSDNERPTSLNDNKSEMTIEEKDRNTDKSIAVPNIEVRTQECQFVNGNTVHELNNDFTSSNESCVENTIDFVVEQDAILENRDVVRDVVSHHQDETLEGDKERMRRDDSIVLRTTQSSSFVDDNAIDPVKDMHAMPNPLKPGDLVLEFGEKITNPSNINNMRFGLSKKKTTKRSLSFKSPHKTTIIAFVVTLVYILSFLPYLCLQITKVFVEGLDTNLKGASLIFYNIFLRSYYINSIANPIIYGVLNIQFRNALRVLLRNIWQKCRSFCQQR